MIGNGEMIVRLLLAALFGALIGIEREYRSKVAGWGGALTSISQ